MALREASGEPAGRGLSPACFRHRRTGGAVGSARELGARPARAGRRALAHARPRARLPARLQPRPLVPGRSSQHRRCRHRRDNHCAECAVQLERHRPARRTLTLTLTLTLALALALTPNPSPNPNPNQASICELGSRGWTGSARSACRCESVPARSPPALSSAGSADLRYYTTPIIQHLGSI